MKINESKEVLKKWGVYKIENIITKGFYIGSTTESFRKRLYRHLSDYNKWGKGLKKATSPILYKAFDKYGFENFQFSCLEVLDNKKSSIENKTLVCILEEKYIKELNPNYNICKFPTLSGCPNLGRKLTQEWKDNIGKKSILYKHKNNQEVYQRKSIQNKELSSIYKLKRGDEEFIGSLKECCIFLNIDLSTLLKWVSGINNSRDKWIVEKIKSQKKKIKVFLENKEMLFGSFYQCDKYFNMWKGFTSTQIVNKKDKILNYDYELL